MTPSINIKFDNFYIKFSKPKPLKLKNVTIVQEKKERKKRKTTRNTGVSQPFIIDKIC